MSRFVPTTVALIALAVAACSSTVEPVRYASLSVANGTSGALSVKLDGSDVLPAQVPNGVSRGMMVAEGAHEVRLIDNANNATVITVRSSADTARTVVAFPRIVSGAAMGISTAVIADTGAVVPAGKSKLRVAHLAANANAVDIWRSQPDFQAGIRVMFPFPYQATSPYLQSDAGTWEVWTTSVGGQTRTLSSGPIPIPAGERRTVLLVDGPTGPRFSIIAG